MKKRQFDDLRQTCQYAIRSTPARLRNVLQPTNTYVSTEVCDHDKRTVCVVRETVIVEPRLNAEIDGWRERPRCQA